ncbi:unnamed protein product [Blepharisma stoltei]|uniref:Palmitoyl-protein thioesterase 1 n=1 Tax=Blepharisma stoltei TaxID=1481888 RepID=A0AAU9K4G5_9CILI|nr:unnamed protein product [Blepharisma stoltei]
MKVILICCLFLFAASHESDYQHLLHGILQGAELISPSFQLNCKISIPRFLEAYQFDETWESIISDAILYSEYCKFTSAKETLLQFKSSDSLMTKSFSKLSEAIASDRVVPSSNLNQYGVSIGAFLKPYFALASPTVLDFEFSGDISALTSGKYPTAIFHGLGDCCYYPGDIEFTDYIRKNVGTYTRCVEIGDGSATSWLEAFQSQANEGCEKIRADPEFANGLNVIGLSQGGLIARSIAEECGMPVHVLVTMGGPHMGVAAMPNCFNGFYCDIVNAAIDKDVYSSFCQNHLGPPGYFKDPYRYDAYLKNSNFLATLNNEKSLNTTYVTGMQNLDNLVLVKFTEDTIVDPPDSEWFGYFENDSHHLVPMNQTTDFHQNLIGLQQLYAQEKMHFIPIQGNHLQFTEAEFTQLVLPYLLQ